MSRYSSMSSCRMSVFTRSPLPKVKTSLPGRRFSLDTSSVTSSLISVVLFHSRGYPRLVETTCLG